MTYLRLSRATQTERVYATAAGGQKHNRRDTTRANKITRTRGPRDPQSSRTRSELEAHVTLSPVRLGSKPPGTTRDRFKMF